MSKQDYSTMLINGVEQSMVPADDRGLLYGDGLFETIAFVDGQAPLWPLHMQRLQASCARLFLPKPDVEVLAAECAQLVAHPIRCVVRITITRGCGGQAYRPPESPEPNRILIRRAFPSIQSQVSMLRSSIALHQSTALSGIKHLNRLEQVLIARECQAHGVDEALVCDDAGFVVEGLSSNILIEQGGELISPGSHPAVVAGVGLAWLKEQPDVDLIERPFSVDELSDDAAIWVINSVAGLRAVTQLDGQVRKTGKALEKPIQRWRELFKLPYT